MEAFDLEKLQQTLESSVPEKRTRLLSFVSDTCRQGGADMTGQHMLLLAQLAENLIERVDAEVLNRAAEVFARLPLTPHSLIVKLANNEIEAAAPVLRHSVVLKDADLIEVIGNKESPHHRTVALRQTLNSPVTDRLIETSDQPTLMNVTQNRGAAFSQKGFRELTAIGLENRTLAEALSLRPDMPEEMAVAFLKKLGLLKPGKRPQNGPVTEITFGPPARRAHKMRQERSLFLPEAKTYIEIVGRGEKTLNACIIELAEKGEAQILCQVIAARAHASETHVTSAFANVSGTRFVELCKRLLLSRDAFLAAAALRTRQPHLPNSQIFYLIRQFDAISSIEAASLG